MNGATAVPWTITNKPPNMTINTKIGSSQNFFRTFIYSQSSYKKDILSPLKIDFSLSQVMAHPDRALSNKFLLFYLILDATDLCRLRALTIQLE